MNSKEFVEEMDDLGGRVAKTIPSDDGSTVIIHCWDGRRYQLTQLPDGDCISPRTGEKISAEQYDKEFCQ